MSGKKITISIFVIGLSTVIVFWLNVNVLDGFIFLALFLSSGLPSGLLAYKNLNSKKKGNMNTNFCPTERYCSVERGAEKSFREFPVTKHL